MILYHATEAGIFICETPCLRGELRYGLISSRCLE